MFRIVIYIGILLYLLCPFDFFSFICFIAVIDIVDRLLEEIVKLNKKI